MGALPSGVAVLTLVALCAAAVLFVVLAVVRVDRSHRTGVSRDPSFDLPGRRRLRLAIEPIWSFAALLQALEHLRAVPGVTEVRAVRMARGTGVFDVVIAPATRRELLVEALRTGLGREVRVEIPS